MSTSEDRFTELWHDQAPHVLAFARRHVGAEAANDVVAETFLVAWRRWNDVTDPPIAWLLVVARKVIQNRARTALRRRALEDRVALLDGVASYVADSADMAITRREALERLARLNERHREALLLVSWDGLTNDQAAAVVGVKPATFRRRLSRARVALLEGSASPRPELRPIPLKELS
jgi:RNA polymerase sigma-70 factor (ECF subfamily)